MSRSWHFIPAPSQVCRVKISCHLSINIWESTEGAVPPECFPLPFINNEITQEKEQLTLMYFKRCSEPAQYGVGETEDGVSSLLKSISDCSEDNRKIRWDRADVRNSDSGTV